MPQERSRRLLRVLNPVGNVNVGGEAIEDETQGLLNGYGWIHKKA